jgi:septum formation topological specificity factor MinE
VRYELGFYIPEDGILHSDRRDSLRSYITVCSSFQRQDLVAVIAQLMRARSDQVHIKVDMNKDDMDNIVFCVATKKSALRLSKDMADLVSTNGL